MSNETGWASVADAARALGISERTLRRRIKAGEVAARKLPRHDGGGTNLLVQIGSETANENDSVPAKVTNAPAIVPAKSENVPDSVPANFEHESSGETAKVTNAPAKTENVPANESDNVPAMSGARAGHDATAELLAQLRGENQFLRGTIEQLQRSDAELRAALRSALASQPKRLESGPQVLAEAQKLQQVATETAPSQSEMQGEFRAQIEQTNKHTGTPSSGPQIERKRGFRAWLLKVLNG